MKIIQTQLSFPNSSDLEIELDVFSLMFKMLLIAVSALLIFFLTSKDYSTASFSQNEIYTSQIVPPGPPAPY